MRNKLLFHLIFCVTLNHAQVVSTIAGDGSNGSADGTGTSATFTNPQGTSVDTYGNIYVADRNNNRIRKISTAGVVTTLAGSSYGFQDGTGAEAKFRYPTDVAVDLNGNIYVADSYNHRIRKVSPDGVVTTLAGSGYTGSTDTTGILARFNYPSGVAADNSGNVYVADKNNNRIRKISSAGLVTTLAGSSYGYYDGMGTDAKFRYPLDVTVDGSGTVYVADQNNHLIRKVLADGTVTTLAGSGSSGNVNGTGIEASFYSPGGVDVDDNGVVYVADVNNHRIRKISASGVVTTIAGNTPGYADGTGTQALFYEPYGIAAFGTSHLFVGDYSNQRIRSVSLNSQGVTTEEVVFAIAGGSSSYNIASSAADNGSSTGGINFSGTGFISGNSYLLKVSFDQGNTWNSISAANATQGTFQGSGIFISDTSGNVELEIDHTTLIGMAQWPGDDGTITMRISDSLETFFIPNSSGKQYILDLTRPEITSVSIFSNNPNNTAYAKLGDIITISFQSSEMLGNTVLPIAGNINGNTITATGSGNAWHAFATVSNIDTEGISTFEITYYDVNGNAGLSTITSTTNQSSVVIDKTTPLATNITIFSSNANNTQAETGDTISVEFFVNENLSNLTDVKIADQTILSSNIVNTTDSTWKFWYVIMGGEQDGNISFSFTANDIVGNGAVFNTANSGSVLFNADPVILSVSSTRNNGSYNAGEIIDITVQFIENVLVTGTPQFTLETGNTDAVINYTGGTGSSTLTFTYTVSESDSTVDLDYVSSNALSLNGGSIKDSVGNNANITLPVPGSVSSLGYNKNIIIDNVKPILTSVSSNTSNGTYNINDNIYIYVYFDEAIYVTGSPKLNLGVQNGEDSTKTINYYSKNGSIVKFRYQVAAGDTTSELVYTSSNSLYLNNGTITDAAGNSATIVLPLPGAPNSLGANRDIVIDGIAPVVLSVTASTDDGTYKINDEIVIDILFSQLVSVSGTPVINLETGSDNGKAYYSSGSNTNKLAFTYNVSSGHNSNDLAYISGTNALYGTIRDAANNSAIRELPELGSQYSLSGSSAIIVDGIIPTVTGITSNVIDSTYKIGDVIDIQVNFSEIIEVTGTPQITLETGSSDAVVDCISGAGGSDSLLFAYTVSNGDSSIDLDYVNTSSLDLNGGTIKDVARNPANLELFSPDSTGSLAANKAIIIDGIIPVATNVSFQSNNTNLSSLAGPGDIVTISLVMSEAIQTPTTTIGSNDATIAGSNSSWTISRTMLSNDISGDIDFTIDFLDLAGNTGSQITSSTDGSTILFDNTAPVVDNITSPNEDGIYIVGDTVSVTISLNEIVQVTGVPILQFETGNIDASADYHSGSGSDELTFYYIVLPGHLSGDLSYQSPNALSLNEGTIIDLAGNHADLVLGDPGSSMSLSANKNLEIDGIVPAIISVTSTAVDSTYKIGDLVPIEVSFDDNVSVTGTPILFLETGINDAEAIYASGSGQSTLVFNYIVADGDIASDLGYAGNSALINNGGYLIDENGNQANLTLPSPGSVTSLSGSKSILVDGIMPTVNMFTSSALNGTYKIGDVLPVTAVFSEIVNVTGEPQLLLENGTANPATAVYNNGSGTTMLTFFYTVVPGDTSSDLDYYSQNALILNSGTIHDSVGNISNLLLFTPGDANSLSENKDLVIDGISPVINLVSGVTQNGIFIAGDEILLAIEFSEPVDVNGQPQLALDTGPNNSLAIYTIGTGTSILNFSYTVLSGDNSIDLDYTNMDALSLNGSTIRDIAGNEAELLLPDSSTGGSLSTYSDLMIDTESPNTVFVFTNNYYNDDSWGAIGLISGTVEDSISGPALVEIQIRRSSDGSYFDGSNWLGSEIWLTAENTSPWNYDISNEYLENDQQYTVAAKSTDAAGNLENIVVSDTFIYDIEIPISSVVLEDSVYNDANWSIENTISGSSSDSISGSSTVKILIENLTENTWWNGIVWSQEPSWLNANGTNSWSYSLDHENLMDGALYLIYSQAQDYAGNMQIDSGFASFTYDISGPSKGLVKDGLDSLDDNWSNSLSTLSGTWIGFIDSTTELTEYLVALGSDSGGYDVVDWVSVNLDTFYVNNELDLQHGISYYISVRARDVAGNMSELAVSNGITIDTLGPIIHGIFEGSNQNPGFQGIDSSLSLFSSADDDLSGILSYSFAVGTALGDTDAVSWIDNWSDSSLTLSELSLQHSVTYWGSVVVIDSAGNSSHYNGDGITIDLTPPDTGQIMDITSLNMEDDQIYTPSQTTLMVSWTGFKDSVSGIASYEYSILHAGTQLVSWTNVGLDTFLVDSSLILSDGQVYYTIIRAIDRVGYYSESVSSNGIIVDISGPVGEIVFDGDSTDIDRQNSVDSYSGLWRMFYDEHSGLEGHEYALFDITDSIYYSEWQFTGLDTSVYLESQNFLENHTYELHIRGIDIVGNIGDIISSDGLLIDLSAPDVPLNLVGRFSSQRIKLSWEPVLDDDFSHYNIYAGHDSSLIELIMDSDTAFAEAFMPDFQDGKTYYCRVSSIDIAGNESDLSQFTNGIPQSAAITALYPDTLTTIFRDDKIVKIKFSQPLINSGYPVMNSIVYEDMNLASVYSDSDTTLTLTILETIASLDTMTISIPGIVDWAGDTTNEKLITFHTYLLGDYNKDFHIGLEDLASFITGWKDQDTTFELGPVIGTVPHLIPQLNKIFDMRDAMTLKRMWDWSNLTPPMMIAYQGNIGSHLKIDQSSRKLVITIPSETVASEIMISYPDDIETIVQQTPSMNNDNDLQFYKSYGGNRKILQANAYIDSEINDIERELSFKIVSESENKIPLSLGYSLIGESGIIVSKGIVDLKFVPTPDDFALHQNFPNPFNPVTRIKYDLIEKSDVSIIIYDIKGRLVKQLINSQKEAGYHSILWNGRNSHGQNSGAGVYFYIIQANNFQQVRKMLLLK